MALQYIPHFQVAQFNITNQKDLADAENSYRATLAQIFGGVAIGIGIYYTWRRITIAEEDLKATQKNLKVTQENLKVSQEGQITERFTRAIDQLGAVDKNGNPAVEIRLGAIYALERIANESDKDYWPIMEILTAYVRNYSEVQAIRKEFENISNTLSPIKVKNLKIKELPLDIEAIITVIGRRKNSFGDGETIRLNLSRTYLRKASFKETNLERASFGYAYLENAYFGYSYLKQSIFICAHLENAYLGHANFENAVFIESHLDDADFSWANLKDALLNKAHIKNTIFRGANMEDAHFEEANLEGAYFIGTNLKGAKSLTVNQISKANTLYQAKLDPELEDELRTKGFGRLLDDELKE